MSPDRLICAAADKKSISLPKSQINSNICKYMVIFRDQNVKINKFRQKVRKTGNFLTFFDLSLDFYILRRSGDRRTQRSSAIRTRQCGAGQPSARPACLTRPPPGGLFVFLGFHLALQTGGGGDIIIKKQKRRMTCRRLKANLYLIV